MIEARYSLHSLLGHVRRRFGVDAHYFFHNSLYVLIAYAVSILRGLVTGFLAVRLLSVEDFGQYQFVLSLVGTVGAFTLAGLVSSIAREVALHDKQAPLRPVLAIYAVWNVLSALVLIILGLVGSTRSAEDLMPFLIIAGILYVPNMVSVQMFGGITRGTGEFVLASRASLFINTVVALMALVLLLYWPSGFGLYVIITSVPAVVYTVLVLRSLRKFPAWSSPVPILKYAWQLTIITLPVSLSWYVDKLVVTQYFGLRQLAILSVALLVTEQVKTLNKELLPIVFRKQAILQSTASVRRRILRFVLAGMVCMAAGIAMYIWISPILFPLLFPLYIADMQSILQLNTIAACTLIVVPLTIIPQYLEAQKHLRSLLVSNWTAALLFILCVIVLVPNIGLLGAVIARAVFRFVYIGIACVYFWLLPSQESK